MFNFFKKNKATINSLTIDDLGWALDKDEPSIKAWYSNDAPMMLSLNYFGVSPDLPPLDRIGTLRNYYRELIAPLNAGLIQVDLINVQGFDVVKTIFKFAQEPSGVNYLASLTIPFKHCSYVIKLQADEHGVTGLRDVVVGNKLIATVELDDDGKSIKNWRVDPYEPDFNGGALMNKSELERYDPDFPQHPLSQVRSLIQRIETSIVFDKVLNNAARFK